MNLLVNNTVIWFVAIVLCVSDCAVGDAIAIEPPLRSKPVDFSTDIAPILRTNCMACHNQKKASGGLNVESPQSILKGGEQGPAAIAGQGAASLLLKVAAHQQESIMPPPDNTVGARPLTPAQLGLLQLWIDQGATGSISTARDVRWQPLPRGYQPALATAVTADGQFAACSRGNRLLVYHLPSEKLVTELADPNLQSFASNPPAAVAHRDLVRCLAFDAMGDLLASGGFREVKLWRRPRVSRVAQWTHDAAIQSTAVSADARWAATGDELGRIRIWDLNSGKPANSFAAHQTSVTGLAFSMDGAVVFSSGLDKSLRAWNVATGAMVGKGVETPTPIRGLVSIGKGEWLITAGEDGIARVWEAQAIRNATDNSIKARQEIKAHEGAVTAIASGTGEATEIVSGGDDGFVRRWNAQTGERLSEFRNEGPVVALAVRADGRRIASASATVFTLWNEKGEAITKSTGDPREAAQIGHLEAEAKFTKAAIEHAQQDLNSYEGLVRIAKVRVEDITKAEEELQKAQKTRDEKQMALDKVKADKGEPASAEKALVDAETAIKVAQTVIDRAKAISQRTSKELADAQQAVKVREELLKQQEAQSTAATAAAKANSAKFRSLVFTADGRRLLVGCEAGLMHVYDAEMGSWSESKADHQGAVRAMSSASNGQIVSVSADRQALVWNAASDWKLERVIGGLNPSDPSTGLVDRVLSLDFSRDGQWLATGGGIPSRSGEVKIWSVADGHLVRELKDSQLKDSHPETVFAVRFSPDGKHLASAAGDRFIKLWNTESGEMIRRLAGHTGHVLAVSWKADGKLLVSSGADNNLKLWDVETGVPVRTMKGTTYQIGAYKREVTAVSFIGDSEQILAASGDGTVRLHRTTSENDILTFAGSKGYQFSVAASPDGRTVLAVSHDGTLIRWSGHERRPQQVFNPNGTLTKPAE